MANNEIQNEVALLREQLETIKREREAHKDVEIPPEGEAIPENRKASIAIGETETVGDDETEDIVGQFKELLKSIDEDINETKPSTLLIVFALGVLIGRL